MELEPDLSTSPILSRQNFGCDYDFPPESKLPQQVPSHIFLRAPECVSLSFAISNGSSVVGMESDVCFTDEVTETAGGGWSCPHSSTGMGGLRLPMRSSPLLTQINESMGPFCIQTGSIRNYSTNHIRGYVFSFDFEVNFPETIGGRCALQLVGSLYLLLMLKQEKKKSPVSQFSHLQCKENEHN